MTVVATGTEQAKLFADRAKLIKRGLPTWLTPALIGALLLSPGVVQIQGGIQTRITADAALVVLILLWPVGSKGRRRSWSKVGQLLLVLGLLSIVSALVNALRQDFSALSAAAVCWGLTKPFLYWLAGWKLAMGSSSARSGDRGAIPPSTTFFSFALALMAILQIRGSSLVDSITSRFYNRPSEIGTISDLQINRRAFGTFDGQPNSFGLFGVLLCCLALHGASKGRTRLALLMTGSTIVLTSQSRTALVCSVVIIAQALVSGLDHVLRFLPAASGVVTLVCVSVLNGWRGGSVISQSSVMVSSAVALGVALLLRLGTPRALPYAVLLAGPLALLCAAGYRLAESLLARESSSSNLGNLGGRDTLFGDAVSRLPSNALTGSVGRPTFVIDNGYLSVMSLLGLAGGIVMLLIARALYLGFNPSAYRSLGLSALALLGVGSMTTGAFISGRLANFFWLFIGYAAFRSLRRRPHVAVEVARPRRA